MRDSTLDENYDDNKEIAFAKAISNPSSISEHPEDDSFILL